MTSSMDAQREGRQTLKVTNHDQDSAWLYLWLAEKFQRASLSLVLPEVCKLYERATAKMGQKRKTPNQ